MQHAKTSPAKTSPHRPRVVRGASSRSPLDRHSKSLSDCGPKSSLVPHRNRATVDMTKGVEEIQHHASCPTRQHQEGSACIGVPGRDRNGLGVPRGKTAARAGKGEVSGGWAPGFLEIVSELLKMQQPQRQNLSLPPIPASSSWNQVDRSGLVTLA